MITQNTRNMIIDFTTHKEGKKRADYVPDWETVYKHRWDISKQLDVNEYLKKCSYPFEEGAVIVKDENLASGYAIKTYDKYAHKVRLIYLLTLNGKILKGGKVKGLMKDRSYKAGTDESWTNRGTPTTTNYVWSQIFRWAIKNGQEIKFYIYEAPQKLEQTPTPEGGVIEEITSQYEKMEVLLNKHLKETLGRKLIGEGNLLAEFKD